MRHWQCYSRRGHVHLCNSPFGAESCRDDWGMSWSFSETNHGLTKMQEKEHLQQCQMLYVNLMSVCEYSSASVEHPPS